MYSDARHGTCMNVKALLMCFDLVRRGGIWCCHAPAYHGGSGTGCIDFRVCIKKKTEKSTGTNKGTKELLPKNENIPDFLPCFESELAAMPINSPKPPRKTTKATKYSML